MTTAAAASAAMYSRPINHSAPDPLEVVRAELDRLSLHAPAAGVARALLDVHGLPCAPIDRDSQQQTAPPFAGLADVLTHYRQSPADGVALVAGPLPARTVFAIEATPAAWAAWVADAMTDVRSITDEQGRQIGTDRVVRDLGSPCVVSWRPPPSPRTRTVAVLGQAALQRAWTDLSAGVNRELAARPVMVAWSVAVAWSAPAEPARQLALKSRKLAPGVRLVADGLLPWYVAQADGWTLSAAAGLQTSPLPEHLIAVLGGRWTAPVVAGVAR